MQEQGYGVLLQWLCDELNTEFGDGFFLPGSSVGGLAKGGKAETGWIMVHPETVAWQTYVDGTYRMVIPIEVFLRWDGEAVVAALDRFARITAHLEGLPTVHCRMTELPIRVDTENGGNSTYRAIYKLS